MPYPETKPYNEGFLPVSELHTLHYMQCGNPDGKPVIFLHGGPGGAIGINQTVWFNPEIYRVILFSQRGCGKSTPAGETKENTTWDLVADIEKIREHLGIQRWTVFGGSWGSTLALAYAQTHPEPCIALCLRGIFLFRKKEVDFFWRNGTNWIWPEEWEEFVKPVDPSKRELDSFLPAYHALLTHSDDEISLDAAKRWSRWESQVARLHQDHEAIAKSDTDPRWARTFALMECHYSLNNAFMPDGHLITEAQLAKIRHIPCIVVQGRYDMVCPFQSAYDLSKAWGKGLSLRVAHDSGHSASEPSTSKLLTEAMDELASI